MEIGEYILKPGIKEIESMQNEINTNNKALLQNQNTIKYNSKTK